MIESGETEVATAPFTVIVDTREQAPYLFQHFISDAKDGRLPLIINTKRTGLKTGDYSIVGHENEVAVERKSHEDLFGTLGSSRARFVRELERLSEFPVAHVVIESTWHRILHDPPIRTTLKGKTVFRSINAWEQRYPTIHWHPMGTRQLAEHKTFRILDRFWQEAMKHGREEERTDSAAGH